MQTAKPKAPKAKHNKNMVYAILHLSKNDKRLSTWRWCSWSRHTKIIKYCLYCVSGEHHPGILNTSYNATLPVPPTSIIVRHRAQRSQTPDPGPLKPDSRTHNSGHGTPPSTPQRPPTVAVAVATSDQAIRCTTCISPISSRKRRHSIVIDRGIVDAWHIKTTSASDH